jgi:hypothetical protein
VRYASDILEKRCTHTVPEAYMTSGSHIYLR